VSVCVPFIPSSFCIRILFFNNSDESFITDNTCAPKVWDIDYKNTKLIPHDTQLGHFRRVSLCAAIDPTDELAYLGTSTGDIIRLSVQTYLLKYYGPSKDANRLHGRSTAIEMFDMGAKGLALAAGSGKGDLFIYNVCTPGDASKPLLINVGKAALLGTVTSLNIHPYQPPPPPSISHPPARTVKKLGSGGTMTGTGSPKKIDTRGRVVPLATAERALIT
jgi:hypothetical protein